MKSVPLPEPIRNLSNALLFLAVFGGICALFIVLLLGVGYLWGKLSPNWQASFFTAFQFVLAMLAVIMLSLGLRWGVLNNKKWAYYACHLFVINAVIFWVLFGLKSKDWISVSLASQETRQWFKLY